MAGKSVDYQFWAWATKKLVSGACDAAATRLVTVGGVAENDRKQVEKLLCDSIRLATEVSVDRDTDPKQLSRKVGEHLYKNGVSVSKLTHIQQLLCGAAISELVLAAPEALKEYASAYRDAMTGAEIGSLFSPGVGTFVGAGATLAWHYSSIAEKTTKAMDAAFDIYSQCGPLAFDKVQKERGVESAVYLDYQEAVCRVSDDSNQLQDISTSVNSPF